MSNTRKLLHARRTAVVMAGVTAAALATGTTEAASAAGSPGPQVTTTGRIYACYSNKTKALAETTKANGCKRGFTELSWNAKGPQGPRGPQGPEGAKGAAGPGESRDRADRRAPPGPGGRKGRRGLFPATSPPLAFPARSTASVAR